MKLLEKEISIQYILTTWTNYMTIINFVRNHPNWIRALAILNVLLIARGIFTSVMIFGSSHDEISVSRIIAFIAIILLIGSIGSVGLWAVTTRLIKYKPIIILLYIPCIFLSWFGVSGNYLIFIFGSSQEIEIMKIISTATQVVVVLVEIFILICFWNKPQK